jgi:hypothetical protein
MNGFETQPRRDQLLKTSQPLFPHGFGSFIEYFVIEYFREHQTDFD